MNTFEAVVDAIGAIENYVLHLLPTRGPVRQAIEADPPAAIIGPLEGQLLYLLTKISGARRILEIGAAVGYSGLWFAQALADRGGQLVTIERDVSRAQVARDNFQQAGYSELVDVKVGDAFAILDGLDESFDLIFVDILRNFSEPDAAPRLLDMCQARLYPGGLLIADNMLVDGEVVQADPTPRVEGILAWNRRISTDPTWESIILPLRDGIAVSRKKEIGAN